MPQWEEEIAACAYLSYSTGWQPPPWPAKWWGMGLVSSVFTAFNQRGRRTWERSRGFMRDNFWLLQNCLSYLLYCEKECVSYPLLLQYSVFCQYSGWMDMSHPERGVREEEEKNLQLCLWASSSSVYLGSVALGGKVKLRKRWIFSAVPTSDGERNVFSSQLNPNWPGFAFFSQWTSINWKLLFKMTKYFAIFGLRQS